MKYLCLVYVEEKTLNALPRDRRVALSDESMAYCDELHVGGQLVGASRRHPVEAATTVQVRAGKVSTTSGPVAETKGQLGGYLLIDVRDLNDAVRIASKFSRRSVQRYRGAADQRGRLCVMVRSIEVTDRRALMEARHEIHLVGASRRKRHSSRWATRQRRAC